MPNLWRTWGLKINRKLAKSLTAASGGVPRPLKFSNFIGNIVGKGVVCMQNFRKLWKRFWRKVLALRYVQWTIALILAGGIWLVYFTSRKKYRGKEIFRQMVGKPVIFAFWHGRSMMLSPITRKFGFQGYAVASRHRDGRLMAKLQRMFGLRPIYGSTTEGGVSVLRQGVRRLREGKLVCLSPDGPNGPRMRLNDGVLYFAKMTGAPIVPVCYSCSRPWFQKRWDRYLVALPFSRIIIEALEPMYIESKEDLESARKKLEKVMIDQVQRLDTHFGMEKIKPEKAIIPK